MTMFHHVRASEQADEHYLICSLQLLIEYKGKSECLNKQNIMCSKTKYYLEFKHEFAFLKILHTKKSKLCNLQAK